ncbi:MAG: hypothetical protein ACKOKF_09050 [Bacteroidota bacterium]
MRTALSFLLLSCCLVSELLAQQFEWTRHDTTSFSFVPTFENQSIAIGNSGDLQAVWLKQFFVSYNSRLYGDYEINSFDSSGNKTLAHTIGPKASIVSLKVLSSGEFVVSGTFMDTLTVDGVILFNVNSPVQYAYNSYLLCFGSNGSLKWSRNFSISHTNVNESCLLAEDPVGNLWISLNDYPNGGYLICMSTSGTDSLQRSWPPDISLISDIVFDGSGSLYLTGALGQDNFNFWSLNVVTNFSYNSFLAKVDPVGDCLWFRSFQDITFDNPHIEADDQSNIYLVKQLFDSVSVYGNFVGGPQWVYDFLVVKFDSSGNVFWALDVPDQPAITGDLRLSVADPISLTTDGFNLLLGSRGNVDLGNGVIVGSGSPGTSRGLVLLHYDANGIPQWNLQFPATYGIFPQQIIADDDGGYFSAIGSGPLRIGNDSIVMNPNFTYYYFLTRFSGPVSTGIMHPSMKTEVYPFVNPSSDGNLWIALPVGRHRILFSDFSGKKIFENELISAGDLTSLETDLKDGFYLVTVDDGAPLKWLVYR